MTTRHVLVNNQRALPVRRLTVSAHEVVSEGDDRSGLASLELQRVVRDVMEGAPVGLISESGMLRVRAEDRARLKTTVVDTSAGNSARAFAVNLALRLGWDHVWSAVSVGNTAEDELGGLVTEEATALALLFREEFEEAKDLNAGDDS